MSRNQDSKRLEVARVGRLEVDSLDVERRAEFGACYVRMRQLTGITPFRIAHGTTNVMTVSYDSESTMVLGANTTIADGYISFSPQGTNNFSLRSNGGLVFDVDYDNNGSTSTFVVRRNGATEMMSIDETSAVNFAGSVVVGGDFSTLSGKNITMNGAGIFTSGTGSVSLNGNTSVVSGKTLTLAGLTSGTFVDVSTGGLLVGGVKNTGFNLNVGTSSGTVAAGNHTHADLYQPLENQRLSTTNNVSFATLALAAEPMVVGGININFPEDNTRLVGELTTQTLGFKTLLNTCNFADPSGTTKTLGFSLAGATPAKKMTISSSHTLDRTINIPDADDTFCLLGATQTLTNKTLTTPVISTISNTGTLTLPTSTDTLVGRATTDTLTNKTLTAPIIATIVNTGTLTLPTSTDTLVGRATTDTLTNKTLTAPTIATIVNGGTLTLPSGNDNLVSRTSTDTLTNKTLTAPIIATIVNTGTLTLPTSTDTLVGRATTDTLTNKTLTTPTITAPIISTINNGGTLTLPTGPGNLVSRTSTDTLTNKTLTAPIISTISNTGTLTLPTSTDTLVGRATTDTLTNKTLTAPVISTIVNGVGTLTLPSSTDTLVGRATTDTLTNKTLTAPVIATISNSGTLTLPTGTDTLVGRTATQTLTNKTLTTPIIASISNTGTLTLPTSTDTLVGRATTDTLTNKTLTAPIIATIVNTGTLTLPTSTDTLIGRATTDTLTNKTLTSPIIATIVNTGTLTLPTSTDTLVGRATTDTLTNKSLVASSVSFVDPTISSKTVSLNISGNATGVSTTLAFSSTSVSRTITMPDGNVALATTNSDQTISSVKTFSSAPIFSSLTAGTALEIDGSKILVGVAKNTAYNANFAGSGVATTVSRSDHTHTSFNALTLTGTTSTADISSSTTIAATTSMTAPQLYSANVDSTAGNLTLSAANSVNLVCNAYSAINNSRLINFRGGIGATTRMSISETGTVNISGLTASSLVLTDSSKNLVSSNTPTVTSLTTTGLVSVGTTLDVLGTSTFVGVSTTGNVSISSTNLTLNNGVTNATHTLQIADKTITKATNTGFRFNDAITPSTDGGFDLGSSSRQWRDLRLSRDIFMTNWVSKVILATWTDGSVIGGSLPLMQWSGATLSTTANTLVNLSFSITSTISMPYVIVTNDSTIRSLVYSLPNGVNNAQPDNILTFYLRIGAAPTSSVYDQILTTASFNGTGSSGRTDSLSIMWSVSNNQIIYMAAACNRAITGSTSHVAILLEMQ